MRPRIYISGPVTGTEDYRERFAEAEKCLKKRGYAVINPVRVNAQLPKETSYRQYMDMSLLMLSMAEAVCMLKGWRESKGARLEHEFAGATGRKIIYEKGEE